MTDVISKTGRTTRDAWRRAMARFVCLSALGLAVCASRPTLVPAQTALPARDALPPFKEGTNMSGLNTANAPLATPAPRAATEDESIRPFRFHASDEALTDLRRRIEATHWPEKETVADESQGVPLAMMRELASHWTSDYDWRKAEAKLNRYPQFITNIDGLDIHFIHVKSKEKNALPLIVTHGWPGSIIEQLKIIDPLVNPTGYGAAASDAFDVVIPSMPGYGFSG